MPFIAYREAYHQCTKIFIPKTLMEIIAFESLLPNISYIKLSNRYLLIATVLYNFRKQNLKIPPILFPLCVVIIIKPSQVQCNIRKLYKASIYL